MAASITIPKQTPQKSALSYEFLREEAILHIQQLVGSSWTDHNTHDPGITILEQLCYAITDIAYRLDYDIKDILGKSSKSYETLHSPAEILTTSPITLLDYRKIIVDTNGVRNAWIEKVTDINSAYKGLYSVAIEHDSSVGAKQIETLVTEKLYANRAICEDFDEITVLGKQGIYFLGTVEVTDTVDDINELAADVLYAMYWNLSPVVQSYSLQEMKDKGKRTDEIFEGPRLTHGFIDDDELIRYARKKEIHASDVIKEVMDVKHVATVQNFVIASGSSQVKNWVFPLDKSKTPSLDVSATLQHLQFRVNGLDVQLNSEKILELYQNKLVAVTTKRTLREEEKDILLTVGQDRAIENYFSIQEQFPTNYGIGTVGLPDTASEKRKAQAKQLKAYLAVFDQLLANYFSQAANFKELVGVDETNYRTVFKQSLLDKVPGINEILQNTKSYTTYLNQSSSKQLLQKNKFLNHLLARYSEKFTAYGMLMQGDDATGDRQQLIKDKITFLKEYPSISSERGKGLDLTKKHKTGLENRITKKLGINPTEEFYMVEHILLREENSDANTLDTYYQQYTIEIFETDEITKTSKIVAVGHELHIKDHIAIFEDGIHLGVFEVITCTETDFVLQGVLEKSNEDAIFSWQHVTPNLHFQTFTNPIHTFEVGTGNRTFCKTEQNVSLGENITIFGASIFNGEHKIISVTKEGFEIDIPFQENKLQGRFTTAKKLEDNYSLQVTFVLPEGKGRYKNSIFKQFTENTIREETPVHITAYTKWLNEEEFNVFKRNHIAYFQ
ncbi:hypothetical protein [Tenacibaculum agarivorans]|uniref:hypothetical protein n=1 Tax=Tenacibaculum agarivorans TaxID=1908389 RepID=UPI00094B9B74|nr:hypothetical protein [Tenacibaculum agarivorans]